MEKSLKIVLIIVLLVCLLDMPYGYFQAVRFIAMMGFGFLAFKAYERKNEQFAFVYGALAVLFQPIFNISLGRSIWNIVDVLVAVGLIITLVKRPEK